MKKILFAFPVIAVLALTACMKNSSEPDPLDPGRTMYIWVKNQNTVALDPANIAFRFDVLLNEFAAAGKNVETDELNVTPSGASSSVDLKSKLFAPAPHIEFKLVDAPTGKWRIKYTSGYESNNDIEKSGILYITTFGKTLKDLTQADFWRMEFDMNNPLTLESGSTFYKIIGSNGYTIHGGGTAGMWNLLADGVSSYIESAIKSDWTIEHTITSDGWTGMYAGLLKTEFMVETGSYSSGNTFYALEDSYEFVYTVEEPLRIHIACENQLMYGGEEKVAFSNYSQVDQSRFPAASVRVAWSRGASECYANATIQYNGYTE